MAHTQTDNQHGLQGFAAQRVRRTSPLPEDKRNKVIRFTKEGKEYADTIVNALRKAELSVIEEIGVEHMQQLNKNMALFAKLFSKAGGINDK